MSVNRNKLLGMLKSHPYLDDIAGKYNNITKSLNITLEDSKTKICAGSVKNVLEYILWNDLWNTYGFFW